MEERHPIHGSGPNTLIQVNSRVFSVFWREIREGSEECSDPRIHLTTAVTPLLLNTVNLGFDREFEPCFAGLLTLVAPQLPPSHRVIACDHREPPREHMAAAGAGSKKNDKRTRT